MTDCERCCFYEHCTKTGRQKNKNCVYGEKVHAYWIERTEPCYEDDVDIFYMCSNCHETFDYVTNYCPHCGAKMEGGGSR